MKKTYSEKLKDPRWQKKRLEILERDGWQCQRCFNSESTLHIHHGYYEPGLEPWDYKHETLWTLCEGCHKIVKNTIIEIQRAIGRINPHRIERLQDIEVISNLGVFVRDSEWATLTHVARIIVDASAYRKSLSRYQNFVESDSE